MYLLMIVSLFSSEIVAAQSTVFGLVWRGVGTCLNCEHEAGRAFFYMEAVFPV